MNTNEARKMNTESEAKTENEACPLDAIVNPPYNEVFLMDCMEGMKQYPDKFFDIAIVDPPFGIGNFVQNTGNKRGNKVEWNEYTPSDQYFNELRRVSKDRIIFGANYYNCFEETGGAIVWVKNQPMPDFSKAVIASCSFHKKIEIYTQTWTNFVAKGRSGIHPCEMPLRLYEWLIKNYAEDCETILDTHVGSGSSRIAAHKAGKSFVGFEIDKDYHEAQQKRFKEFKKQLTLF